MLFRVGCEDESGTMDNFQRDGSISNSQVSRAFEERVGKVVVKHGLQLESNRKVPCGLDKVQKKSHAFDLGSWYHMIPPDVEFWELDTDSGRSRRPKNPNSGK